MTYLQKMAFSRIIDLNESIQKTMPVRTKRQDSYELTRDEVIAIETLISEQKDWLDALNREEHS